MITHDQIDRLVGSTAYAEGEKLGMVGQLFLDDQSGQPEWVTVRTGLFGKNESFVPLALAELRDDALHVPYDKATVKNAPNIDPGRQHIPEEEEARLYEHYDLPRGGSPGPAADRDHRDEMFDDVADTAVGRDVSGPTTDDAMTRSEERLNVYTRSREAGRVRLRKYVVTENVQRTVPVRHEEVRVEREPITEANRDRAMRGPGISEEEHEVVLHEERPVVEKETVPVERVRLTKDTVTDEETVSEEVRKERIEGEGDQGGRARDR